MNKSDLQEQVGMSSSTLAKMAKGETVSMTVLERICDELDCDFGDIVSFIPDKED
jgi:DNA-binding Xre family transcriptional regulator